MLLLFLTLATAMSGWITAQESEQAARRRMWASREAFYKKPVGELIRDLERDPGWLTVVQRLRVLDDRAAIGPLKLAFEKVSGKLEKQSIAAALLSLGVRDGPYFEFLAKPAVEAVRSGIPFPPLIDERGEPVAKQLSPTFLSWCAERGQEPTKAAQWAAFDLQMDLTSLALARDPRATEIFLEALRAPNLYLVAPSILGLAFLGRKEAIGPIIEAVGRFPPSSRPIQAVPLLLFDDPRAQEFARELVPKGVTRSSALEMYRRMLPLSADLTDRQN